MRTSETRTVSQCTYTPISKLETLPGTSPPRRPFVAHNLLAKTFSHLKLARLVLSRVREEPPGSSDPPDTYTKLADAVFSMWSGDLRATINTIREYTDEQIAHFATKCMEIEAVLLNSARKGVADAMAGPALSEAASKLSATPLPLAQVSEQWAKLRESLTRKDPASAELLEAISYFPTNRPDQIAPGLQLIDIRLEENSSKMFSIRSFVLTSTVEPIGFLHLERMQFTPVGYERGELVHSLPLMPQETVRVTHREWSRVESEYVKLVSDEIETTSESALAEKSELTDSTNTQQQHTSGINASVTASGGFGSINITSSFGYNSSTAQTESRQASAKRAQELTRKAASRVKRESKISFRTTTTSEQEDISYREIKNSSENPVRFDFHRLMKKWRIDLYRYGVRLTYDIVIPEPGSYLLRKHVLLKRIENELLEPFSLPLNPKDICEELGNPSSWLALEHEYQTTLEPPPKQSDTFFVIQNVTFTTSMPGDYYSCLEINAPDGYFIRAIDPVLQAFTGATILRFDSWYNGDLGCIWAQSDQNRRSLEDQVQNDPEPARFAWQYHVQWMDSLAEGSTIQITFSVTVNVRPQVYAAWQSQCFQRICDAARATYEGKRQRLTDLREAVIDSLNREDALMLRKMEREEIMKGVLRWVVGPNFRFYPQELTIVSDEFTLPNLPMDFKTLDYSNPDGIEDTAQAYYDENTQSVKFNYSQYGEIIKFFQQAIEWENVAYILYPYFWTQPNKNRWDFKQFLYHSDFEHRNFLRAGAARVVLPVRPGFEKDFVSIIEGNFEDPLPPDDPYLSVAYEMELMAKTNYPYTESANTEKEEYLFSWNDVPGSERDRLLHKLKEAFYVAWADDEEVSVSKDGEVIKVARTAEIPTGTAGAAITNVELESVTITLKAQACNAILAITGGTEYTLAARREKTATHWERDWKIYREQNLVDTWYEFTPTGALDVVVGHIADGPA